MYRIKFEVLISTKMHDYSDDVQDKYLVFKEYLSHLRFILNFI